MFMKILMSLLILIFSLQSWTKADDIRDFEIEGMSVGNSLKDYMNMAEIKKAEENASFYNDNRYIVIFSNKKSSTYDAIEITYNPNDKNYIIQSLIGKVAYPDKYDECKLRKKDIVKDFESFFSNYFIDEHENPHWYDKNSTVDVTDFLLDSGGYARVSCTDWSVEMLDKKGWVDTLKISVGTEEFSKFLSE